MSRAVPYSMLRFAGTPEEVSEQWHASRRRGLGGSDMGAVMGLSKWKSAYEVWLEKTGRADPEDIGGKPAVEWGNRLEPVVAAKFADMHPELRVANRYAQMWSREHPCMFADIDRMLTLPDGSHAVLEIKTAGQFVQQDWDEGVPPHYLAQVVHYLAVTGWAKAYVAVLIGGNDYREYEIGRDEADVAAVVSAAESFWRDCVEGGAAPEAGCLKSEADARTAEAGMPGDEYALMLDSELPWLDELAETKRAAKEAGEAARRMENQLHQLIGSDKGIETETKRVTWVRSMRNGKLTNGGIRITEKKGA